LGRQACGNSPASSRGRVPDRPSGSSRWPRGTCRSQRSSRRCRWPRPPSEREPARQQQRIHHVVHVVEVAALLTRSVNLDPLALQGLADEDPRESLLVVGQVHPGAVGVGQAQAHRFDPVNRAVQRVVHLGGELVDSVHVDRHKRVLLVHRQRLRPAVDLAGAGKDDLDPGIPVSAALEQR